MGREDDLFMKAGTAHEVLDSVRASIVDTAGPSLVGLYVYGSLVAGDFDDELSDLDLIAVLTEDPSDELATRLGTMHDRMEQRYPRWGGRIEVVYVAESGLRQWRDRSRLIAVISPGEPFHLVSPGPEWSLTWFPAREEGLALVGPPIDTVIPEIPRDEFLDAVRKRLEEFRTTVRDDSSLGACAYVVLTICRGLYTLELERRPSKLQAAAWVADQRPEWASLIESALAWRRQRWSTPAPDPTAVAETRRFVRAMTDRLDEGPTHQDS